MAARKQHRRGFGRLRQLKSKRYQAGYLGPDGAVHYAPVTFETKMDAEAWFVAERRLIAAGTWTPPKVRAQRRAAAALTFGNYAESWMKRRDLKPKTRHHYRRLLDVYVLPKFRDLPIVSITPLVVAEWHHDLAERTGPTMRAHAYSLLRTICLAAVAEDVIPASPCRVRGAGSVKRAKQIEPATLAELQTIMDKMPDRLKATILLAAWCALRFGEIAELRRSDVDLRSGVLHIRRAVVRVDGQTILGTPKSDAGSRDVAIPPHILPALKAHIETHAAWGRDGLLFPGMDGQNLPVSTLAWHYRKARKAAGRPDLRFHDLRHTGAVLAAQSGATLAELMSRLGHSTPGAALRYQHAAAGRDAMIAARLSEIAKASAS